jgi:hypothetical protein
MGTTGIGSDLNPLNGRLHACVERPDNLLRSRPPEMALLDHLDALIVGAGVDAEREDLQEIVRFGAIVDGALDFSGAQPTTRTR